MFPHLRRTRGFPTANLGSPIFCGSYTKNVILSPLLPRGVVSRSSSSFNNHEHHRLRRSARPVSFLPRGGTAGGGGFSPSGQQRPPSSLVFVPSGLKRNTQVEGLAFVHLFQFEQQEMVTGLINANPVVYERKARQVRSAPTNIDEYADEPIDQQEIFDHIRDIKDPEHPYSLEELKVVTEDSIEVNDKQSYVRVTFTPTVEHCSMATVIGLCLRVKLMRSLPSRYKVDVRIAPGTHATEAAVNKQLNDKERVAAALENPSLSEMVDECLAPTFA